MLPGSEAGGLGPDHPRARSQELGICWGCLRALVSNLESCDGR